MWQDCNSLVTFFIMVSKASRNELYSRSEGNKNDIVSLKTKQGLVQWVGGTLFVAIVALISRLFYKSHS